MSCLSLPTVGNWSTFLPVCLCTLRWACFFPPHVVGMEGILYLDFWCEESNSLVKSDLRKALLFWGNLYWCNNIKHYHCLSCPPGYLVPEGLTHFFLELYRCTPQRTGLLGQLISLWNYLPWMPMIHWVLQRMLFNVSCIVGEAITSSPLLPFTWWCDFPLLPTVYISSLAPYCLALWFWVWPSFLCPRLWLLTLSGLDTNGVGSDNY